MTKLAKCIIPLTANFKIKALFYCSLAACYIFEESGASQTTKEAKAFRDPVCVWLCADIDGVDVQYFAQQSTRFSSSSG